MTLFPNRHSRCKSPIFAVLGYTIGCYSAADPLDRLEITICDLKFEMSSTYGKVGNRGCKKS
jgi:hypothetical protein